MLSIGVEAESFGVLVDPLPAAPERPSAVLTAWVVGAQGFDQPVAILSDGTGGFARSGAMLLRLPDMLTLSTAPDMVEIALRLTAGAFSLPPRVLQIAINGLAVRQVSAAWFEQGATGLPDQVLTLSGVPQPMARPHPVPARPGRKIAPPPTWNIRDRSTACLSLIGRHWHSGSATGSMARCRHWFGIIRADYVATAGQAGNLLAQTGWSVGGVAVRFTTHDPLAGGEDSDTPMASAIPHACHHRPLVDADLQDAALAAPSHARAEVIDGRPGRAPRRRAGTRTLVALPASPERGQPRRPQRVGLATALERHLRPRLPIGERLRVAGPDYVSIACRHRCRGKVRCGRGRRGGGSAKWPARPVAGSGLRAMAARRAARC